MRNQAEEKNHFATQVPFQQRATLESHRRRCTAKPPIASTTSSAGVSLSSPTLSPVESKTPLALESKSSKPEAIILPNTNVTSNLIPRSLTNLRTNTQLASNPKELASASPAGSAKYLEEGQNFAEATNPLHFFGLKYLASSKVLSPGQGIDSNDLTKRPKAELC